MRFVLHYRGTLRANGSPSHKHDLRQTFHEQLTILWKQPPLSDQDLLRPRSHPHSYSLLRPLASFTFAPLVTAEMNVIAELHVTLMRPESPGHLLTQGGDIDNRLKTLFDALTMPRHQNALPSGAAPGTGQTPFFCVFEDDNLVTSVSVRTEQLLEPGLDPSLVDVAISVATKVTRYTVGNIAFS